MIVKRDRRSLVISTLAILVLTLAMNETQQQLVDLQWRLDAESEALGKLLAADHVDEAAVLTKLDQVTAIEQQVKKVNFTLLVRIQEPARSRAAGQAPCPPAGTSLRPARRAATAPMRPPSAAPAAGAPLRRAPGSRS